MDACQLNYWRVALLVDVNENNSSRDLFLCFLTLNLFGELLIYCLQCLTNFRNSLGNNGESDLIFHE